MCALSLESALILYHRFFILSRGFSHFFEFFSAFFASPSTGDLFILSHTLSVVNCFFEKKTSLLVLTITKAIKSAFVVQNDSGVFTLSKLKLFQCYFMHNGVIFVHNIPKNHGGKAMRKSITIFSKSFAAVISLLLLLYAATFIGRESEQTLSKVGSRGAEVTAIQQALKDRGLFNANVTGYYGEITEAAVRRFQKQQGLTVDGIAGPATLRALGITIGSVPSATTANVNLLARIISAEARGEPYTGQVAVGAVILNRIEHPSFPDTLSGVIYQNGAFTAIVDGQFNEPVASSAYSAARDALNGWDPTGGAIYYYNPKKTSNAFMHSRPIITVIGNHRFCS